MTDPTRAVTDARGATCPACDSTAMLVFYGQPYVPVNSCLLVETEAEALAFPRGELRLAVCEDCGFITNLAFDETLVEYSDRYEETQGFSAHFRQFADALARRWIERYDIRGKEVLEIGCGKAEFLTLMCRFGGNRGLGVDPGVHPERVDPDVRDDVTLVPDFFNADFGPISADVVICRHTLEHLAPVGRFLADLRAAIGDRLETIVLFELPDVLRVLREAAFWDVYHEHCSYFSPGSLARLFRRSGFEVLDLSLDYDDQYILIEARPAATSPGALGHVVPLPVEEPAWDVVAAAKLFGDTVAEQHAYWRETLAAAAAEGRDPVIWGAGSKGVSFLTTLRPGSVRRAVDINPYKADRFMAGTGQRVVLPQFLAQHPTSLVVAMNPVYLAEIVADLDTLGVEAELLTL